MSDCTVEFVIEPFVEGSPGPHVVAGIGAMEQRGLTVTMGPFGSAVSGPMEIVSSAISAMVESAVKDGARRVLVEVVIDKT